MAFWNRLSNSFHRARLNRELQSEFMAHLAEIEADELRNGATREEARRNARSRFGNSTAHLENTSDRDLFVWLETFLQDTRYTLRQLRNAPGFTVTVVLLLALGIGVNASIFTLLNRIVLHSLPLPDPDRLVIILERLPGGGDSPPSWLDQRDLREQNHVLESVGAFAYNGSFLLRSGDETRHVIGAAVTPDYFSTMGVEPIAGRLFGHSEAQAGHDNVALLRADFWRSDFGSDPNILGKTIELNGAKCTIIGLLPASFRFPKDNAVVWMPLVPSALQARERGWHGFPLIGRLKHGVTLQQAHVDLDAIMQRLARQCSGDTDRTAVLFYPLQEWTVGQTSHRLSVLQCAALAIFLMACANVSSLLLARYSARRREFAMRSALGASAGRQIRQHLTESLILAGIGCLASIAVAWGGVRFLLHLYGPSLPRAGEVRPDFILVLFTIGLTIAGAIVFGIATALQSSSAEIESTLRESGRAAGSRKNAFIRKFLVAVQLACAVTLVCGAVELTRTFQNMMRVDPGVKVSNLLTMHVSLPETQYTSAAPTAKFFEHAVDRLNRLPGVESAASINMLPVEEAGCNGDVEVPGLPPHSSSFFAEFRWITGDYFRAMGIPLIRGRNFLPEELAGKTQAAIINETMARTLWHDRDPIGWKIKMGGTFTVVGIARDVRQTGLSYPARSEMYMTLPTFDEPLTEQSIVLRSTVAEDRLLPSIRRAIRGIEPNAAVFRVKTMHEVLADSVSYTRMTATLLFLFAVLALCIAAFGLYGVMSYVVGERMREFAIRLAVGAKPLQLVRMVLGQSIATLGVGLLLGLGGVALMSRLLTGLLFGVRAIDVSSMAISLLVLSGAALLGLIGPALKAIHVDPIDALREE